MSKKKADAAVTGAKFVEGLSFGLKFDYKPTVDDHEYVLQENTEERIHTSDDAVTHKLVNSENLEALKALQPEYAGKINFCYIDPPYNTGNTAGFVYKDSFRNKADSERHSTWLTFMAERLFLTKELLTQDGVITISIDDREVHYLRLLCDEIFGENNFIAQMIVDGGTQKNNAKLVSVTHEYLLVYAKDLKFMNKEQVKWRKKREGIEVLLAKYEKLKLKHGSKYDAISAELKEWVKDQPFTKRLKVFHMADKDGLYTYADLSAPGNGPRFDVLHPITGKPCQVPSRGWGTSPENIQSLIAANQIIFGVDETFQPLKKMRLRNTPDQVERSILAYPSRSSTHLLEKMLGRRNSFNNPKNLDYITDIIRLMSKEDAIVLDYFAGSGTTGHAVLNLNEEENSRRTFIMVTNNESNIYDDVTYPRMKAAITGQYLNGESHKKFDANLTTFTSCVYNGDYDQ